MVAIRDSFLILFYFYTGKSPDAHRCAPQERSWEDVSSTVLRESAADPAKWLHITVEIAYKFIMNFNGSNRPYDLFWLYRWIAELSRKTPAMALQIRDGLLAAISRSERSGRIWQAQTYAGSLKRLPEEDSKQREQRR
jgi:hypothetical protein